LVSATVLGKLAGLLFGVDILITRDIRLAPAVALTNFTDIHGCPVRSSCPNRTALILLGSKRFPTIRT
jgi:energy-converting hydrogenase Eha subunit G